MNSYALNFDPSSMSREAARGSSVNLSASPVLGTVPGGNLFLNPDAENARQRREAELQAEAELRRQQRSSAATAGLGNAARNAETLRDMAVNAQSNAAANVANQLNNLADIRRANAESITAAMNVGAGLFRR